MQLKRRLRRLIAQTLAPCSRCGFVPEHAVQIQVDHIDGNRDNNVPDNLQMICANCHALKTFLNADWRHRYAPRTAPVRHRPLPAPTEVGPAPREPDTSGIPAAALSIKPKKREFSLYVNRPGPYLDIVANLPLWRRGKTKKGREVAYIACDPRNVPGLLSLEKAGVLMAGHSYKALRYLEWWGDPWECPFK